ncbi:MAG: hypothetical protein Q8755_02860, partial [Candidatus Phytoplasma australasiaticum]|nr:hypothetical protein [Candidatus Phytoplasma australasiaticum]
MEEGEISNTWTEEEIIKMCQLNSNKVIIDNEPVVKPQNVESKVNEKEGIDIEDITHEEYHLNGFGQTNILL